MNLFLPYLLKNKKKRRLKLYGRKVEGFEKLRYFLLQNCIEINLFAVFFLEPRLQTAYGCSCTFLVSLKEASSSSVLTTMVWLSGIDAWPFSA